MISKGLCILRILEPTIENPLLSAGYFLTNFPSKPHNKNCISIYTLL